MKYALILDYKSWKLTVMSCFWYRWVLSQAKKDGADESIAKYDGK